MSEKPKEIEGAIDSTEKKARRKWKPTAKQRKAKLRRKLLAMDANSPWLGQIRYAIR